MNLLRALATVSSFTLVSRILGFVRDTVIARAFGAGLATDAFFVAFRIPNLLRRLFAEGAFSQAFVPILAEYRNRRGEEDTRDLMDHVAGTLMLALGCVTAIGMLVAPVVIWLSAPGFQADVTKFELTVALLRVTFPYILFMSLTAMASALLNTWGRFSVPAATPILLNLTFIGFALWLAPYFHPPVMALAWAVFFGGAAQLAFQLPFLRPLRLLPRPRLGFRHAGVRRVLRQMAPALFGVSVSQVSLVINTVFASFLVTGSVSWLYYADRLMEFPTGLLGAALGTILLPSLAKSHANAAYAEYSRLLDWGLRLTILLAVPAAAALAILAVPLVVTLFYYGAFSLEDVLRTREAVVAYSVGLVGLILVRVLAPGFYSRQDIRTPVRIGLITLAFTQLMNLLFIYPLQHAGLALAIGLGACVNAALLYRGLRRTDAFRPAPGWRGFLWRVVAATLGMAVIAWFAAGDSGWWLVAAAGARVLRLLGIVAGGSAIYFAALWALGIRWRDFAHRGIA